MADLGLGKRQAPRLAIVGASARAAAFSALRAGFEVVTADLFADEDLRRRCPATRIENYPDGLAGWLAEQDVDAWMYTGALENHPELVDRMAAIRPLWGNRGDVLRRVRDPMRLQAALADAGIAFPETRRDPTGLLHDGSWLCKTCRGANGSGVWSLNGDAALDQADTVYQQRVPGASAAALLTLSDDEARLVGVTEQLVGEPEFGAAPWAYCGSIARPDWEVRLAPRLEALGRVLAERFGARGLIGVDLRIEGDQLWVIEVNPRFPASAEVAEGDSERSAVGAHASCFGVDLPAENPTAERHLAGKAVLFAKQAATIDQQFHAWAMVEADAGRIADVPVAGIAIEPGQPVLTVLVEGDFQDARERLLGAAGRVESRLGNIAAAGIGDSW